MLQVRPVSFKGNTQEVESKWYISLVDFKFYSYQFEKICMSQIGSWKLHVFFAGRFFKKNLKPQPNSLKLIDKCL